MNEARLLIALSLQNYFHGHHIIIFERATNSSIDMADQLPDSPPDERPKSRRRKSKAKADEVEAGPSNSQDHEAQRAEASTANAETAEPPKAKKKPRKLERRSVQLQVPVATLDTRVERLETQFEVLNARVEAVENKQTRRVPVSYRRASSTSTRATTASRTAPGRRGSTPRPAPRQARPSLAEQLRQSQQLRKSAQKGTSDDDAVEEIERGNLSSLQARQRQVALTGQYNIPLPANLSAEDIQNLKSGLTAAGSIARSLASVLTSHPQSRNQGAGSGTATPTAGAGSRARGARSNVPIEKDDTREDDGIMGDATSTSGGTSGSGNRRPGSSAGGG